MEKTITKETLKSELHSGVQPAIQLLYSRYSDMLYSYILQFVPQEEKAEEVLIKIFTGLSGKLQEVCNANLGIYCWLQVEARKILLSERGPARAGVREEAYEGGMASDMGNERYYFSLLEEASQEQRWVFRELFLEGRRKEDLAKQLERDLPYIDRLLKESLSIIRKNIG